ncbi:MAG: TetR/AcrR family transcriptional regulator [Ectothiorhodospiraceae bacterium]|nr:TetR/AcrR family transcriptional regulator [Ectothiorhodospiraceae bacterium]
MAYRRTERMAARMADKRDRIVRAARELIAQGGFRAAQMAAVAEGAGVSTGSIYSYFPSKAELFTEVFRRVVDREVVVIRENLGRPGPARERLRHAVADFARRAHMRPRLAHALIAEPVDPAVESERLRYRQAYARAFEDLLRKGVHSGELPPQDPRVGAAFLVGGLAEVLVGPLAPERPMTEAAARELNEQLIRYCIDSICKGGDPDERA